MRIASLTVLALALAAAPALAQPNSSQNPRVGKLAELTFANGSDAISVGEESLIGKIAGWYEQYPDGIVVLDAHASRVGKKLVNRELSIKRAQTIRGKLVELGVDPDRIVITAYGEKGIAKRRVVAYGTRAGLDAIVAWANKRGSPVIRTGLVAQPDRAPQPGIIAVR